MDNTSVSFRKASKADIPDVLHLYAQPDIDDGKVLSLPEAEKFFARIALYPDYHLYVAVKDRKIVGTFALLIMDNLGHLGSPSAVIEDVAIAPQWQGLGIGRKMMRFALKKCAEKGCYKAMLSSNLKRDKAHAFYDSLGFERHGYSFCISAEPGG